MPTGLLQVNYEGNMDAEPKPRFATIVVELHRATYVLQPENGTTVAFFGRPPSYGPDRPATYFSVYTDKLVFDGSFNSIYAIVQVQTDSPSVKGTITASDPLPYPVTVGTPTTIYGTLKPGDKTDTFAIPLTEMGAEQDRGAATARLEAIRKGQPPSP